MLERGNEGDLDRACRCITETIACQIIADGEIFDGTYRSMQEAQEPVRGKLDWQHMDPLTRFNLDVYYQRLSNALRYRLKADSQLCDLTPAIEAQLQAALKDIYPVVWDTYDPNWREFIVSTFQLVLLYYEDVLPAELVASMETSCRRAIYAAVDRARTAFTPLNTNIRVMHVMICDWFGERWHDQSLRQHAEAYAAELLAAYRKHHAVPEYNSPTYNGVVFTFIGFWQLSTNSAIRAMGKELEAGLWEDFAAFYNPAMHNVCGPYSRAYELDMAIHTALPAVLYISGVDDEMPPLSTESDCDPVLALSTVTIPEAVIPLLKCSRGERTVCRQFEELAERGDPRDNHSLCTTTAWITDDLMLGAMKGSKNTSYQLHPAVAFWRNSQGSLSTMKLLRRSAEGELKHFHTVYMDFDARAYHMSGVIRACAGRDIRPYFEIESPDTDKALISNDSWQICGLNASVKAVLIDHDSRSGAPWYVESIEKGLRICFPMRDGQQLEISLDLTLS